MKGKAGRFYKITPKGEAALKAVQAYVETFNKEIASKNQKPIKEE